MNNTAYVAYRIDKFKMVCRFEKKNETSQSLRVRKELFKKRYELHYNVLKNHRNISQNLKA